MVSKNKPRDYLKVLNQSERNLIARIREISEQIREFEDQKILDINDLKDFCCNAIFENLQKIEQQKQSKEAKSNE